MVNKLKVAIISTGSYPVPAVRGGAAEALTELLLQENEKEQLADFTVFSIDDPEARAKVLKCYTHSSFQFINPSAFCKGLDHFNHFFAYNVFHMKRHLTFKNAWQRIMYIHRVAVEINRNDYDRIIFENEMALLWTLKYKNNLQKYRGKYYYHLHNHPERYAGNEELAKNCCKVIGVSRFINTKFAEKIGADPDTEQFTVLKNVVDEKIFEPDHVTEENIKSVKETLGIGNRKMLLYVGRLIPAKGVAELMDAFQLMNKEDNVLVIVGSFNFDNKDRSEYENMLEEKIQHIGKDKVIFTGYVNHDNLPAYYAAADLVILPSVGDDAANLAAIETMMMHRPLISTTIGGIPEYVQDGGILLDYRKNLPEKIAATAEDLLSHPDKCSALTARAAEISKDRTVASFYRNFLEIIQ